MSSKDYIVIAIAIRNEYNRSSSDNCNELIVQPSLAQLAEKLADHFEVDNPRFDRERFLDLALSK